MFGNGTRFVWQGVVGQSGGLGYGETQDEEVVEGALVHEVEAGFVAVDEGDGGAFGEAGKGISHAIEGGTGGLGGDLLIEEACFEGPGAAQAPIGCSHVLDHAEFQAVGGLEAGNVVGEQGSEGLGTFVLEDYTTGEEPMAEGVAGRALLALRGFGAAGEISVGARCANASERGHRFPVTTKFGDSRVMGRCRTRPDENGQHVG